MSVRDFTITRPMKIKFKESENCLAGIYSDVHADGLMSRFILAPSHKREVVIHNGEFHCDDVLAVALLRICVGDFNIIRTRNTEFFKEKSGRLVIDVGEGTFDHHGEASYRFFTILENEEGKTFSIKHCGASLIARCLERMNKLIIGKSLFNELFEVCVQDNGNIFDVNNVSRPRISFVHLFNKNWNENRNDQDKAFEEAVSCVEMVIRRLIASDNSDLAGEKICTTLDINQEVVELPCAGLPWVKYLARDYCKAVYVIYQGDNDTWFLQCVPESSENWMSKRKPLPESWAFKKRDEGDFVFCHVGRFIAGFKTKEAAFAAAKEALSN